MNKSIRISKLVSFTLITFSMLTIAHAEDSNQELDKKVNQLMLEHYDNYKDQEYFSAIQTSIYMPNKGISSFHIGNKSRDKDAEPISNDSLFQIGSITKSFTAALILKLDEGERLKLMDPIGKWLPEYKKWSDINIKRMLNMTSGLPNYSDTPAWNYLEYKRLSRKWDNEELIEFVYPTNEKLNPPLKTGYFYSNTNYVLTDMAIEKATGKHFKQLLQEIIIEPSGLANTFYPIPEYSKETKKRLISGYNYNQYDNPFLVGKDIISNNLSWAAAAGGIVATSKDVVKWVKTLFIDDKLLNEDQKKQLTEIVSLSSGEPIKATSADDPKAFGLGVIQAYNEKLGNYWYYQGETLGFRALYVYMPCNKLIVTSLFNSAANSENDHAHELVMGIYEEVLNQYPEYRCGSGKKN